MTLRPSTVSLGLAACLMLLAAACGGENTPRGGLEPTPIPGPPVVLVGAGDIGECGPLAGPEATALLLDQIEGTVFTAGDNAYPQGRAEDFKNCYEPWWGRHKSRTRPSPGNHDYETPGAAGYFAYFGSSAGPAGAGYYSYSAGDWMVLSLNSNIPVDRGSAQVQWMRGEVARAGNRCTAAYFHHPPFTSADRGESLYMRDLWRELNTAGVDLVVAAHEHLYERFGPMNGNGEADRERGSRLFVVGTGGGMLVPATRAAPNSEVRLVSFGVLKLTLSSRSYRWEFIRPGGGTADFGDDVCR
jgi:acid phosphatase type 7